jgi:hypothetical protein
MNFFKSYINTLDLKATCINELSFSEDIYNINANITYENGCLSNLPQDITIDIFANAKSLNNEINLHERIIK